MAYNPSRPFSRMHYMNRSTEGQQMNVSQKTRNETVKLKTPHSSPSLLINEILRPDLSGIREQIEKMMSWWVGDRKYIQCYRSHDIMTPWTPSVYHPPFSER